jgi:hypothetical protein
VQELCSKLARKDVGLLCMPLSCTHIIARIFVARHVSFSKTDDPLIVMLWEGMLSALRNLLTNPNQADVIINEVANLEYVEILLLVFHMLQPKSRAQILALCMATLKLAHTHEKAYQAFVATRLVLIIEFILVAVWV